jgi:hypothetical protein
MHHTTFHTIVRRAVGLQDRRSLLGGLSAALLALVGLPLAAEAKKKHKRKSKGCKKRVKACREGVPIFCEGNQECIDTLAPCCKKACKSLDEVARCCVDVDVCTSDVEAAAILG